MVSLQTISDKLELGKAYYLDLIAAEIAALTAGSCYAYEERITCLGRVIRALTWDVNGEYNTTVTQRIYGMLLKLISTYSGAVLPYDPSVAIPGQTIVIAAGDIMQTNVVNPTEGEDSYTFAELIGQEVLTVYRGTSTVLRAHSAAPDNEFAQFNSVTGEITVSYAFGAGETLWVEYKTTT